MLSTNIFQGSYVYAPLPPATSYGHRAELWGVVSVHVAFCIGKFRHVPSFQEFLDCIAGNKQMTTVVVNIRTRTSGSKK